MNTDQRLQLICAALTGLCANPTVVGAGTSTLELAADAVDIADTVIKRLQAEGGEQ